MIGALPTWVLVIFIAQHGFNSTPAVALAVIPGYVTQADCKAAAALILDHQEGLQTRCIPGPKEGS